MASNELLIAKQFRSFTQVITKLGGRDKVNKSVQMGSKFLFYVLTQMNYEPSTAKKFKKLSGGIGNARKVDRLLKSSVEFQKAVDAFNSNKGDEFSKYLTIMSALCFAVYWYTDNKVFLGRIKVLDNVDIKGEVVRGNKYWLMALLILTYLLSNKMNSLYQQRKELNDNQSDQNALNEIDNQLHLKRVQFVGYCCDILIALNNSGLMEKLKGSKLNDGQYGMIGLISATSVLYRMWPSN